VLVHCGENYCEVDHGWAETRLVHAEAGVSSRNAVCNESAAY